MKFWIGTSGFQYAEWKGNFYPEDLPAAKMLPFYAEHLSTTEINYTFHRIPAPKTIDNWSALTPGSFRFALKAPQKITHWSKLRECADTLRYFYDVVSALGEKLGPVLFQLPKSLKHYGHEALRCVSLTLKNWRRQGLSPLITVICGYAAKITCRATSNAGLSLSANKHQSGSKFSFISNMKKQASARSWRRK
jgi:uncharacterized protein YecE (DUF72 family)